MMHSITHSFQKHREPSSSQALSVLAAGDATELRKMESLLPCRVKSEKWRDNPCSLERCSSGSCVHLEGSTKGTPTTIGGMRRDFWNKCFLGQDLKNEASNQWKQARSTPGKANMYIKCLWTKESGGIRVTGKQVSLAEAQRSRRDGQNLEARGNSPQWLTLI